jgi:hypothetical protein
VLYKVRQQFTQAHMKLRHIQFRHDDDDDTDTDTITTTATAAAAAAAAAAAVATCLFDVWLLLLRFLFAICSGQHCVMISNSNLRSPRVFKLQSSKCPATQASRHNGALSSNYTTLRYHKVTRTMLARYHKKVCDYYLLTTSSLSLVLLSLANRGQRLGQLLFL